MTLAGCSQGATERWLCIRINAISIENRIQDSHPCHPLLKKGLLNFLSPSLETLKCGRRVNGVGLLLWDEWQTKGGEWGRQGVLLPASGSAGRTLLKDV